VKARCHQKTKPWIQADVFLQENPNVFVCNKNASIKYPTKDSQRMDAVPICRMRSIHQGHQIARAQDMIMEATG
jgi:hypothetical protein